MIDFSEYVALGPLPTAGPAPLAPLPAATQPAPPHCAVPQSVQKTPPSFTTVTSDSPSTVHIVGQEHDSWLVLALHRRDPEGALRMHIACYDVGTGEQVEVYVLDTVHRVVTATVNTERTVVAFTTEWNGHSILPRDGTLENPFSHGAADAASDDSIYASFIGDHRPPPPWRIAPKAGRSYQRMQFLHGSLGPQEAAFLFFWGMHPSVLRDWPLFCNADAL